MNKLHVSILFLTMMFNIPLSHAEGKGEASGGFWESLRAKIEQIVPQKKVTATTAVGGVRGAKMAADDVYWKGEKLPAAVDADDLDEFKAAMSLAAAGDLDKAKAAFAEFIRKNPDSPLRKDADLALAQLKTP